MFRTQPPRLIYRPIMPFRRLNFCLRIDQLPSVPYYTYIMQNFHDQKLWQDSFVVLMEIHDTFDGLRDSADEEIVEDCIESATAVASKIADGLSRVDRRFGRQVLLDAIGFVAVVRTHLAVAWGRGLVSDDVFKSMDDKYSALTEHLQQAR